MAIPWLEENFLDSHLDNSYVPFSEQSKWHFLQEALSESPDPDPTPGAGVLSLPFVTVMWLSLVH